ncbi:MAG: PucR family transcriptional regulator ligand-binding domain-containing protein [Blautia sp.]|nr:PucR family transcriptional regulator ligand-binding domain-containing protein [Blautia sp.]
MSITLRELYDTTRYKYHLTLYTNPAGLDKPVNWVYVSEDINTFDFLKKGDLVITTGVSSGTNPEIWLYNYLNILIQQETCGLIINTGNYLTREHITDSILTLCAENDFTLFTMPWEVSLHDITRDYYQRLFLDNQSSTQITASFHQLLTDCPDSNEAIAFLSKMGFPVQDHCCICLIDRPLPSALLHKLEKTIQSSGERFHAAEYEEKLLLVCCRPCLSLLREALQSFSLHTGCSSGMGPVVSDFSRLPKSFCLADTVLSFALRQKKPFCSYEDLGFFQILMNVSDIHFLKTYKDSKLKILEAYDQSHNTAYLETLYQYLLCNGSIQAIASAMHCHRNTINYRIHILKEMLDDNLDDMQIRFEYMAAFYIREYIKPADVS